MAGPWERAVHAGQPGSGDAEQPDLLSFSLPPLVPEDSLPALPSSPPSYDPARQSAGADLLRLPAPPEQRSSWLPAGDGLHLGLRLDPAPVAPVWYGPYSGRHAESDDDTRHLLTGAERLAHGMHIGQNAPAPASLSGPEPASRQQAVLPVTVEMQQPVEHLDPAPLRPRVRRSRRKRYVALIALALILGLITVWFFWIAPAPAAAATDSL